MSDDENYQIDEVKPEDDKKITTEEKIQLNKTIQAILTECQKSQPVFPPLLSKKICESNGLQSTEDTFFSLMSNVVEYSLKQIIDSIKEIKQSGRYKKDLNDHQLRTIDLQKYFQSKNILIAKPRCYPEFALETEKIKPSSHYQ